MNGHQHTPARRALCESFMMLEAGTWHSMAQSAELSLSLGEESITDFVLLFLRSRHRNTVFVRKFNRRQERKSGADWEWWFTDGTRWFGMLVQAKRLNPVQLTYDHLFHGGKSNHARQANSIIGSAGAAIPHLYPAYCFYNWVPTLSANAQACQCRDGAHLLGFTIADAYGIKRLILDGTNQYTHVARVARPVHCLVCCPNHASDSVADSAHAKVNDLRGLGEIGRIQTERVPEPVGDPPEYVRGVVGQDASRESAPPRPGLAGIVVFNVPKE